MYLFGAFFFCLLHSLIPIDSDLGTFSIDLRTPEFEFGKLDAIYGVAMARKRPAELQRSEMIFNLQTRSARIIKMYKLFAKVDNKRIQNNNLIVSQSTLLKLNCPVRLRAHILHPMKFPVCYLSAKTNKQTKRQNKQCP